MITFKTASSLMVFLLSMVILSAPAFSEPIYKESFVAAPGLFPANHGATIAELPSGDLIDCWYAGSAEKAKDVQIYCSTWNLEESKWSAPTVAVSAKEKAGAFPHLKNVTLGNPALFVDREKTLWLFYSAVSIFKGWSGSHVDYKISKDSGKTWSKPHNLKFFFGNLTRNKPIQLDEGRFMVPLYRELIGRQGYTCTLTTHDGQLDDRQCHKIFGKDHIQPTLVLKDPTHLFAYLRINHERNVQVAEFDFNRNRWGTAGPTNLPNSDSAVDSILAEDGSILLAYNDSLTRRDPLSLAFSLDGKNFTKIWDFEKVVGVQCSYPAMIRTHDGMYHVTYTYDFRSSIKHVYFNEEWLRSHMPALKN